jgi:hypothetical protein
MDHFSQDNNTHTAEADPPVTAQTSFSEPEHTIFESRVEPNHAEFVLFLGAISLFTCGLAGIMAWLIGRSDLKKIRAGLMSDQRIGLLKLGRTLGILGTIIFFASAAAVTLALRTGLPQVVNPFSYNRIDPQFASYIGQWNGEKGSYLNIYADGRADFKSRTMTITGGKLDIRADSLSVSILSFSKKWIIRKAPELREDGWFMELDDETFSKTEQGLIVDKTLIGPHKS